MQPTEAQWLAPKSTREIVSDALQVGNLLLRLYQYLPSSLMEHREQKHEVLENIAASSSTLLDPQLLRHVAERQSDLLKTIQDLGYRMARNTKLKLTSKLTCGLSTPNLVERGMTLLRPYGIPMLPGSGVKGVIASHLAEVLAGKLHLGEKDRDEHLEQAGLLTIFGYAPRGKEDEGRGGEVLFFDALPEAGALRVDITTPHHARYYQGLDSAAAGFEAPTPLPFLTVGAGAVFQFPIVCSANTTLGDLNPDARDRLRAFEITHFDRVEEFLADALASTAKYKGFGAQTNLGYGRFHRAPT